MKDHELIQANRINKEIRELELFISCSEKVWTGKIIKRTSSFIFKSNDYGAIDSVEFNMNTEIKNKVLDVLREHLKVLKNQLENIWFTI